MLSQRDKEAVAQYIFGDINIGDKCHQTARIVYEDKNDYGFILFARMMHDTSGDQALEQLVIDTNTGASHRNHVHYRGLSNDEIDRIASIQLRCTSEAMMAQREKVLNNIKMAEESYNTTRSTGREPKVLY